MYHQLYARPDAGDEPAMDLYAHLYFYDSLCLCFMLEPESVEPEK
jgi:hypothetical protein